jgi:hypothetical protein
MYARAMRHPKYLRFIFFGRREWYNNPVRQTNDRGSGGQWSPDDGFID